MTKNKLIITGAAAAVTTIVCGLITVSVQQNYRMSLNDPQIEIAENIANDLTAGATPEQIVSQGKTDLTKTLSPFVAIYNDQGQAVVSSALYNNAPPVPPSGTFETARARGEYRFSWQPAKGVREAIVLRHYVTDKTSGFVLAGRSMREVEQREQNLSIMALVAWLASLVVIAVAALLCRKPKHPEHEHAHHGEHPVDPES
jgi:hypothetical protein